MSLISHWNPSFVQLIHHGQTLLCMTAFKAKCLKKANSCLCVFCNDHGIKRCDFHGVVDGAWFRGGFPSKEDVKEFGKAQQNKMKEVWT